MPVDRLFQVPQAKISGVRGHSIKAARASERNRRSQREVGRCRATAPSANKLPGRPIGKLGGLLPNLNFFNFSASDIYAPDAEVKFDSVLKSGGATTTC